MLSRTDGTASAMQVSMGWAAYNMTAPYLLLHYCFFKSRGLRVMTIITAFTSTAIVGTIVVLIWIVLPNEYDYANVLRLSYRFFAAQKSGELPADNPIAWRGNSGLTDRAPDGTSLIGGFYDDGGNSHC
jgi:endoglucanase